MKVRIPNSGGPGNMNQMLKQAQKMQADIEMLQADLEQREYTAVSGGGMIEVTVDGKHTVKAVKIKPEAIDPDDAEMLEDLIIAAYNDAATKADEMYEEKMGTFNKMGGGMF